MSEEAGKVYRLNAAPQHRPRSDDRHWIAAPGHSGCLLEMHGNNDGSSNRVLSAYNATGRGLTSDERGVLATLLVQPRTYEGKEDLVRSGHLAERAFILQKGWACAHRSLPSGARQVLSVYVPGDLIGYPAPAAIQGDRLISVHTVSAITDTEVSEIGMDRLASAFSLAPGLARAMLWDAPRANAMLEERLISLGRRSARERTAHFFLELSARVQSGAAAPSDSYACPLSQYIIADALGLSAEHLNRVLKQLRVAKLLHVRHGCVEIMDRDGLVSLADFDAAYLSPLARSVL